MSSPFSRSSLSSPAVFYSIPLFKGGMDRPQYRSVIIVFPVITVFLQVAALRDLRIKMFKIYLYLQTPSFTIPAKLYRLQHFEPFRSQTAGKSKITSYSSAISYIRGNRSFFIRALSRTCRYPGKRRILVLLFPCYFPDHMQIIRKAHILILITEFYLHYSLIIPEGIDIYFQILPVMI